MSHVDDGALHAYLDGELPPAERARLEAHVAECAACRTRLEEERALVERASGLLGLAQPPERAAPPLHQLQRRRGWRLRVPIAWAASVVLAVGLGYYIGGTGVRRVPPQGTAASAITDSVAAASGYASAERAAPPAIAREPRAAKQVATRQEEPRDRAAANARPDSIAAAAGVVPIGPQAALREATPAPVPSAALTISRASADLDEARGRLVATEWPVIRPGPAREILGAAPVGIPGLAVRNIRRSPTGDVVLVEQALDSATMIQIFQQRMEDDVVRRQAYRSAAPQAAAPSRFAGTERLARFIGGVRVEIAGPISVDSLNRLLEQLKAIP
jgi:hypothetical protein